MEVLCEMSCPRSSELLGSPNVSSDSPAICTRTWDSAAHLITHRVVKHRNRASHFSRWNATFAFARAKCDPGSWLNRVSFSGMLGALGKAMTCSPSGDEYLLLQRAASSRAIQAWMLPKICCLLHLRSRHLPCWSHRQRPRSCRCPCHPHSRPHTCIQAHFGYGNPLAQLSLLIDV